MITNKNTKIQTNKTNKQTEANLSKVLWTAKKETERKTKESKKRGGKITKHIIYNNSNNNHSNPKSITNIQIHHFKTTFMCLRYRAGVPFDSVRRFRASLLLHTTCVHSCCTWRGGCVAVHHKNKNKLLVGPSGVATRSDLIYVQRFGFPPTAGCEKRMFGFHNNKEKEKRKRQRRRRGGSDTWPG